MAQAMGSTAQVMAATNKQLKVEDIQRTMMSFEQESTKMDMAGEMSKDIVDASVAYSCNIRMDPSSLYYYLHPSHSLPPLPLTHSPTQWTIHWTRYLMTMNKRKMLSCLKSWMRLELRSTKRYDL